MDTAVQMVTTETVVIIPAYNAPRSLMKLLSEVAGVFPGSIIVVDDGSEPAVVLAEESGVILLRHDVNKGKGTALRTGMDYAFSSGARYAVTLDADYQHPPELIPVFLKMDQSIDIVVGKRSFTGHMPWHRRLSNQMTSAILTQLCGVNIEDSQCGYRRYNLAAVNQHHYNEDGFMFETEVILNIARLGRGIIQFISIPTIYLAEQKSHIRNWWNTFEFIRLLLRTLFR